MGQEVVALPDLATALAPGKSVQDVALAGSSPSVSSTPLVQSTCKVPYAPGIHAETRLMQPITEYVDGPDPDQDDIDEAERFIALATGLVIGLGVVLTVLGVAFGLVFLRRLVSPEPV